MLPKAWNNFLAFRTTISQRLYKLRVLQADSATRNAYKNFTDIVGYTDSKGFKTGYRANFTGCTDSGLYVSVQRYKSEQNHYEPALTYMDAHT